MKQLELTTNKRLIIVEYDTEAECAIEWALVHAFKNAKVHKHGYTLMPICKGSDLNEDIAKGFIHQSLHTGLFAHYVKGIPVNTYCYKTALEAFDAVIYAYGYHWGENPMGKKPELSDARYDKEREFIENNPDEMVFGDHYADWSMWHEAESRTFNPSKCIIFEIM